MSEFRRRLLIKKNKSNEGYIIDESLLLLLDGTNNTGNGFSPDSPTWKDLSNYGNDAEITNIKSDSWVDNHLIVGNSDSVDTATRAIVTSSMLNIDVLTLQIVTNASKINISTSDLVSRHDASYGIEFDGLGGNHPIFRFSSGGNFYQTINQNYYYGNKPYLITLRYDKENEIYDFYVGKDFWDNYKGGALNKDNYKGALNIPNYFIYGISKESIYSIRLYNRILSEEEIAKNFEVDKLKFNLI